MTTQTRSQFSNQLNKIDKGIFKNNNKNDKKNKDNNNKDNNNKDNNNKDNNSDNNFFEVCKNKLKKICYLT